MTTSQADSTEIKFTKLPTTGQGVDDEQEVDGSEHNENSVEDNKGFGCFSINGKMLESRSKNHVI